MIRLQPRLLCEVGLSKGWEPPPHREAGKASRAAVPQAQAQTPLSSLP